MISILKLSNGVEVTGKLEIDDKDCVILDRPVQINYRNSFSSMPSVSFQRYIMFSQQTSIAFNKRDILNMVEAREAFSRYYDEVVEDYYGEIDKVVDAEFDASVSATDNTKEKYLKGILEMMSVEGQSVN